jgi:cell division protease FtsH
MADNQNKHTGPDKKKQGGKKDQTPQRSTIILAVILLVIVGFIGYNFMQDGEGSTVDTLETGQFVEAVEQGRVVSVSYAASDYTVTGEYYPASTAGADIADAFNGSFSALNALMSQTRDGDGSRLGGVSTESLDTQTLGTLHKYTSVYVGADSLGQLLEGHQEIQYEITLPSSWLSMLTSLLPIILFGVLIVFFFSQMNKANNSQLSFGKNRAKKTTEERPDVKFSDVAGVDEAVEEMQEVKDFLANPEKYQAMGAKIPRGCLLVGPPGTGKTLLARAVAGEAGVPFFSISGSDFVEMFVGVGASRVRDLFDQAKKNSPCIIFIDEIDAVGRQRGTGLGGGNDEREQTLNQLLVEMDGFGANEGVILIAATNRPDVLDPALMRPGRFDRQVIVSYPDVNGREAILKVHARKKPLAPDVKLKTIAKTTAGFTGADLENLLNEAALLAARKDKKAITMEEIKEATIKVVVGAEKKTKVMSDKEKKLTAYHEAGHAILFDKLETQDPVHEISIIPRGMAGGYTMPLPSEDKSYNSRSEMLEDIIVCLGGRVAEALILDDISTGASNDIEKATKTARAMVTKYGMTKELGCICYGSDNGAVFLGRDMGSTTQNYSEATAAKIDELVLEIVNDAYAKAEKILSENIDKLHDIAAYLIKHEKMGGEDFEAVMNGTYVEPEEVETEETVETTETPADNSNTEE